MLGLENVSIIGMRDWSEEKKQTSDPAVKGGGGGDVGEPSTEKRTDLVGKTKKNHFSTLIKRRSRDL
jgi:tRNA G37 N-methylase TrmD